MEDLSWLDSSTLEETGLPPGPAVEVDLEYSLVTLCVAVCM